jgi:hypothetical protein
VGREQAEGAHHVLGRVGEGRGAEELGDLVVDLGKDVEQREEGLVVVQRERLVCVISICIHPATLGRSGKISSVVTYNMRGH